MVDRAEQSPALDKATEQMAAVIRDYLVDDTFPQELVHYAVCEAMRVLREHRWPAQRVLAHCRSVISLEVARLGPSRTGQREALIEVQLTAWLLGCYYRH